MRLCEKKIFVCCSHAITGGTELLHQLVHELRANDCDAVISYYPFEQNFSTPGRFLKYDAPSESFCDDDRHFIVLPEVATGIAKNIKKAKVGIWWLSVDNYFLLKHQSKLRDIYVRYKSAIKHRLPLYRMHKMIHFVQSAYAAEYLKKHGIKSYPLSDYLGCEHFEGAERVNVKDKEDIIVYNPKKGQKQTNKLIDAYPEYEFIPIANISPDEVSELLSRAKIYIDFGHHPGKDRMPREAAIAKCCVITGRKGSARYYQDLPILDKYKLKDYDDSYVKSFGELINNIYSDYCIHISDFEEYRRKISEEYDEFRLQVKDVFFQDIF